jgi:hypothetical protein
MYPKSHDWDVGTELMAAVLYVLQWSNWQRGGGKGEKPELISRPQEGEKMVVSDAVSIDERKAANENELAKRRARRAGAERTQMVAVSQDG